MTDKFEIIPLEQFTEIILNQLHHSGSVFGIPKEAFFKPAKEDPFRITRFGQLLETPVGVAAGPHTQLAQNIITAWLTGARFIELKTIQTLDELEIAKPCIDMQDEGYNCEWSQELKINRTFDQYLNAWILIYLLKTELGHDTADPGFIFNMSVGYDFEGIMKDNVQWFLDKMQNAQAELDIKIETLSRVYPQIKNINIPATLSDNVTLSTMHGCPPEEIETIGRYLIKEKKLHTTIKLNPTLLGKEELLSIIKNSGFDTEVPDMAFEHDLKYPDALRIITNLQQEADKAGVSFGIKLTNTLESNNNKDVFPSSEKMMYMSGRALHPISVNLAKKLQKEFDGRLDISFSGGADAFNISNLLACGLKPVTVCSDILKPGGYGRLGQYISNIDETYRRYDARSAKELISAHNGDKSKPLHRQIAENLEKYAGETLQSKRYKRTSFHVPSIKTSRPLGYFDCIHAPCLDTCPTNQGIPGYMYYTANGEFEKAFDIINQTNPFPYTTGMVCDHPCTTKCTRINYDEPLHIREIKRFVTEYAHKNRYRPQQENNTPKNKKVAVIGAGPGGLSCARYLAEAGIGVEIFEAKDKPGGMVSGAIPPFRLTQEAIQHDIDAILELGVSIHYNSPVDKQRFQSLQKEFDALFIAAGAQKTRKLMIEGADSPCVVDPLEFLSKLKLNAAAGYKEKSIAVVGGGNTAMDAARAALRLTGDSERVTVIYRRRIEDMPAEEEEITALLEEGIKIIPLASPLKIKSKNRQGCTLTCIEMKPGEKDESGRRRPVPIEGSEFDLNFDIIIPAVGQDLDIDFASPDLLKTAKGSYKTKVEKVYIGGDALRGASTVINAVADGRKAAEEIIIDLTGKENPETRLHHPEHPYKELKIKKYRREYSVPVPERKPEGDTLFSVLTETYTEEQAKKEASRCLMCDEVCDVCNTVCPNLAFHAYSVTPRTFRSGKIVVKNGETEMVWTGSFDIKQKRQILHIADWCNQCGNCATFCPTAGKPYEDKPHLYLLESSFKENRDGYFFEPHEKKLMVYNEDDLWNLHLAKDYYLFENKALKLKINKDDFEMEIISIKEDGTFETELNPVWEMVLIMDGVNSFYKVEPGKR